MSTLRQTQRDRDRIVSWHASHRSGALPRRPARSMHIAMYSGRRQSPFSAKAKYQPEDAGPDLLVALRYHLG